LTGDVLAPTGFSAGTSLTDLLEREMLPPTEPVCEEFELVIKR